MTKSTDTAVIVARFHVDELHKGHRALIEYALEHHERVIVFLGVRKTPPTETIPLSFAIRKTMVEQAFPTVVVLPLDDMRDDVMWSANLDKMIYNNVMSGIPVLYHGRDSFRSHYHGFRPVIEKDFEVNHISGTERRQYHAEHPNLASVEFRQGVIHAMQTLPYRIYLTVDIALLRKVQSEFDARMTYADPEVLMAKKPLEDKWRLPGGFVEMHESFIEAARRELMEETGLIIESGANVIGDFEIKDWRIRDAKNVSHKTILVEGWHSWGTPKPADDISECKWISLTELASNVNILVMEEHHPLIKALYLKHMDAYAKA